ncbi:aldehyde dehydrogenase family protein [Streptomyces sp. NPDC050433]|uniref:aldehyde dehydrogenase family protein n=1 Tax=Streptomyces sp. NPDC050433 TaxID=3365615 RepID=UPI0037A174F8
MIERDQIFINGKWIPSSGAGVISVTSPVTEETVATIPAGSAEDVDLAVRASADAFPAWSRTSVDERVEMLHKLAQLTEARSEDITRAVVSEIGQPAKIAQESQGTAAIEDLRSIAESLPGITWEEQVGPTVVAREAAGVVGAITPWNGPMRMVCMKGRCGDRGRMHGRAQGHGGRSAQLVHLRRDLRRSRPARRRL